MLCWGPASKRIKPAFLIVSQGTSLHILNESLTNCSSPRRASLEGLPRTKLGMGWAGSVRPTPTPARLSPTSPLLQTPWPHFNQDGPFQSIKGWCVFPKANLAGLPSRKLHEQRGQKTTSLHQSGQLPSPGHLALFLTSGVQSKTDSVGNNVKSCLLSLPLFHDSSPLLLYHVFLLLKENIKLI